MSDAHCAAVPIAASREHSPRLQSRTHSRLTMGPMTPENRRKLVPVALAVGLAVIGLWLISSRADARAEVERLEKKLEISRGDAGAEIEALEAEISGLAEELTTLRSEFDTLIDTRAAELAEFERVSEELSLVTEENATLSAALGAIGDLEIALMVDLTGSGLELAQEFADQNGATLMFETVSPGNLIARPGAIIDQLPIPGTPVIPGSVIWVQVFSP
jgi:cell division protein FtsB